ncbi:MAG: hypothetical protein DCF15_01215 [Phormidesmis priestleyi]|uniref:Uncharacterized protein n=1 Tax=Phormidesmis priestleyi TaxID=268141 RepID=A0A2W4XWN5_9CYAN|nr:MAG: hypothetical protein DCF15_01215 [Phormidesmis priestleyi]
MVNFKLSQANSLQPPTTQPRLRLPWLLCGCAGLFMGSVYLAQVDLGSPIEALPEAATAE